MLSCSSDNSLVCFTSFLPLHPSLCGRIVRVNPGWTPLLPLWLDLHSFLLRLPSCLFCFRLSVRIFNHVLTSGWRPVRVSVCHCVCVCVPLSYLCGWFIHLSLLTNHNLDFMPLLLPLTHVKVFCCLISLFCTPTVIIFLLPVLPYYCTSTCN